MYVKTRIFERVNGEIDAHSLFFLEKQNQVTYNIIKKICIAAESSWNLLINIQKQLFY